MVLGSDGHGQIALDGGQPDIGLSVDPQSELRASPGVNPILPADRTPDALIPEDPTAESGAQIASIATIARAALTPRPWKSQRVEVRKGDSLTTILKRAGIDGRQVHSALRSLKGVYDPRGLRAGQELVVTAASEDEQPARLLSIAPRSRFRLSAPDHA